MRRFALFVFCSFALVRVSSAQAVRSDTAADPYRWLEDVNGSRAMTWVKAENAKTVAVLEKDPRFAGIYKTALAMAQAKDRIPYVSFMAGALYNFWQDSAHVRGIWRTDHARELPHRVARVDDGARSRRAGEGGEGQLGVARRGLRATGRAAVSPDALGRR